MTTGKRDKPPFPEAPSPSAQASRVIELVTGGDPSAQRALAERHLARARRPKSVKAMPAVRTPPRDPVSYLRPTPTRSRVLNAFLHEATSAGVVAPPVGVLDEQALAPKLVELARRYMAPMAAAAGNVEAALRIAAEVPEVTGERVARLVIRRALTDPGALGMIARDYDDHLKQAGAAAQDDLLASAMLAAFAGRIVAHADRLLGTHVRDEVTTALRALVSGREGSIPPPDRGGTQRRPVVRSPSAPVSPPSTEREARALRGGGRRS